MHESDLEHCPFHRGLHPLRPPHGDTNYFVPGSYYPPEYRNAVGDIVQHTLPGIFNNTLHSLFSYLAPYERLTQETLTSLHMPHLINHIFKTPPEPNLPERELILFTETLQETSFRIRKNEYGPNEHEFFSQFKIEWWPIIIEGGILPFTLGRNLERTATHAERISRYPKKDELSGDSIVRHALWLHEKIFSRTHLGFSYHINVHCLGAHPTRTFLIASSLNLVLKNLQGPQSPIIGLLDANNSLKSHSQLIAEFDLLLQ